jgi:hypothetical protein
MRSPPARSQASRFHPVSVDPVPLKLSMCPAPDMRQLFVAADLIKLIDLVIIEIMLGRFL